MESGLTRHQITSIVDNCLTLKVKMEAARPAVHQPGSNWSNQTNTRTCISLYYRARAPTLSGLIPSPGPEWGLGARQVSQLARMLAAGGSREAAGSPHERARIQSAREAARGGLLPSRPEEFPPCWSSSSFLGQNVGRDHFTDKTRRPAERFQRRHVARVRILHQFLLEINKWKSV